MIFLEFLHRTNLKADADVLGVYARACDENHPVVCYDEAPKQLVSEVRMPYMDEKGVKYEDSEYQREGGQQKL